MAAALDILHHRRLVLLDPERWDDKDDAYFMRKYRHKLGIDAVKALCFTTSAETYHHWKIYSHGNDGVCFEFFQDPVVNAAIDQNPGIDCRAVSYLSIDQIEARPPPVMDWPFTKRAPYAGEGEFRMVCACANCDEAPKIQLDAAWIRRIKLSPWLNKALEPSIQQVFKSLAGREDLSIYQSRLIDYARWRDAVGASPDDRNDSLSS